MVKENPNKESCRERMKELIRVKKLNRNQVVKRCMREFDDVHKSTFYGWYDEVINEPDIVSWEEDRKLEIVSEFQIKQDLVQRMFNRNMEQYDKYCDDYEDNEDVETLANIEKTLHACPKYAVFAIIGNGLGTKPCNSFYGWMYLKYCYSIYNAIFQCLQGRSVDCIEKSVNK